MPTVKQIHHEINNRAYVVGRLEDAGVPSQEAWDYHGAHRDKLLLMSYERLNEWLESYIEALRSH